MKSESEPITDDEWLLRRVRVEKFRTDKEPVLSPSSFEPRLAGRDLDTDGISLYREACLQSPDDVLATVAPEKRDENGIVRLSVAYLKSLGLSVEGRPVPEIAGHVVVPELNTSDYGANKGRFTKLKNDLAVYASRDENIVRYPPVMQSPRP